MDQPPPDSRELVARVQAGDQIAARQLIDRLYPLVVKIVRSYLPRNAGEDEWTQEVFVRVLSRLDQYRAIAPLEHWVSRLAVRVCLDALRSGRRRRELRWADLTAAEAQRLAAGEPTSADTGPADALAACELVDKLLATLTADDQVIINMLDIQQYSVAEVARLTGRTQAGVKVRSFRARNKLRQQLRHLLGESSNGSIATPSADFEP